MKRRKQMFATRMSPMIMIASLTMSPFIDMVASEDVLGRWDVNADLLGKTQFAQLEVRQNSGELKASLIGDSGVVEINDISIDEDTLRFQYEVDLGDVVQPVLVQLSASEAGFDGILTTGAESLATDRQIRLFRPGRPAEASAFRHEDDDKRKAAGSASSNTAEGRDFLGAWEVTLRNGSDEQLPGFKLGVLVMDVAGRVVVGHSGFGMNGPQERASEVSVTNEGLIWKYGDGFFGAPLSVEMSKRGDQCSVKLTSQGQDSGIRGIAVRRRSGPEVAVDPELLSQESGMKMIGQIDGARVVQIDGQRMYFQRGHTVSVLITDQPLIFPFKLFELSEAESVVFIDDEVVGVLAPRSRLRMLDVTRPSESREMGVCSFPGGFPDAVKSDGSLVLIANWNGRADSQQLHLIDIADPKRPTLRCSFSTPKGSSNYQIDMHGSMVFLATTMGLRVIDITDPDAPSDVSITAGRGQWVRGVDILGTKAYLATSMHGGASWLQIIEVANPRKPVSVSLFRTTGGAQDVAVGRSHVYVADRSAGLVVIDASDPNDPRRVGFFDVSGRADQVSVAGDLVFLNVKEGRNSHLLVLQSEL